MIDGALCGRKLSTASDRRVASLGARCSNCVRRWKSESVLSDYAILARATELERAILTLNRLDFKRLHREVPDHAGIIICTEDPDRLGQAQRIVESIDKEGYLRGQLIRVYRPS